MSDTVIRHSGNIEIVLVDLSPVMAGSYSSLLNSGFVWTPGHPMLLERQLLRRPTDIDAGQP